MHGLAAQRQKKDTTRPNISLRLAAAALLALGAGRVENAVLGPVFIGLLQKGLNLARVESYLQTVVLGGLLILAVIADRIHLRMMVVLRD